MSILLHHISSVFPQFVASRPMILLPDFEALEDLYPLICSVRSDSPYALLDQSTRHCGHRCGSLPSSTRPNHPSRRPLRTHPSQHLSCRSPLLACGQESSPNAAAHHTVVPSLQP